MSNVVIDSSVFIAILKDERFELDVLSVLEGAIMSAANYSEIFSKLSDFGMTRSAPRVEMMLSLLDRIEPFTEVQARAAGELRAQTREAGLSLGDRACLALAIELGAIVYTADRPWSRVDVGCDIRLVR